MSEIQQNDTDLIEVFKENITKLGELIQKIQVEFETSTDPIARARLNTLKSELLVEDVKLQEFKIEKITTCLQTISPQD